MKTAEREAARRAARDDHPPAVRRIDNVWIPMSDGVRLAARLWLPAAVRRRSVPTILECAPYRKDDYLTVRDTPRYSWFARNGFACVRVDTRGTGSSEGLLLDEYTAREQDDTLEVLTWIAAQPWSTGHVGLMGISWSGFAALQAACHRPPELRAVVVVAAADDRFDRDAHYYGGSVLACDMLPWAARMFAFNARAPDPAVVGGAWRDLWLRRLEQNPLFAERWLQHQRRDSYWEEGSVSADYARIRCPVLLLAGWNDPYREGILSLLGRLQCPRRGIIGPWSHQYPDRGRPGPAIGFLHECRRWWDQWLEGVETGVMGEPLLRVWMREPTPPGRLPKEEDGHWTAEDAWPPRSSRTATFSLAGSTLAAEPTPAAPPVSVRANQSAGLHGGLWVPSGEEAELPGDQRRDDELGLTFTSAPLPERLEVLGVPSVTLNASVDRPLALVAVRLCDVFPDGSSALVARGVRNLAYLGGSAAPAPVAVGTPLRIVVPLQPIGYSFPAGHRLRVSVSPTCWPMLWPAPAAVTLELAGDSGVLTLPVRTGSDDHDVVFGNPEPTESANHRVVKEGHSRVGVASAAGNGSWRLTIERNLGGHRLLPHGLEIAHWPVEEFTIADDDPLSATVRSTWRISLAREGWRTDVETESSMSCDAHMFRLTTSLEAHENGQRVATRSESFAIPRDHN